MTTDGKVLQAANGTSELGVTTSSRKFAKSQYAKLDAEPNIVVLETRIVDNAACAARNFSIGETVFREEPLIIINKERGSELDEIENHIFDVLEDVASKNKVGDNYLYSIYFYWKSAKEIQLRIQEFFCPDLGDSSPQLRCYHSMCEEACQRIPQFAELSPKDLVRYLLILRTNQHASGKKLQSSALYELGSKVTHSCDQNCLCVMDDFTIEYRAIKQIDKHEMLTFSYIGSFDLWKSTVERRRLMQPARFFECCCNRCVGPDYSRRMRCPMCADHRTLYFLPGQPSFVPVPSTAQQRRDHTKERPWKCYNPNCGQSFSDEDMPLQKEQQLMDYIVPTYFQNVVPGQVVDRKLARQMLEYTEQELGHYHWLSALMVYTQLALSLSALQNGHAEPDPPKLMSEYCERLLYWFSVCYPNTMEEAHVLHFVGNCARVVKDYDCASHAYAKCLPLLRTHWTARHPDVQELEYFVIAYGTPYEERVQEAMISKERQNEIIEHCKVTLAQIKADQEQAKTESKKPIEQTQPSVAPSGSTVDACELQAKSTMSQGTVRGKAKPRSGWDVATTTTATTTALTTSNTSSKKVVAVSTSSSSSSSASTADDGTREKSQVAGYETGNKKRRPRRRK